MLKRAADGVSTRLGVIGSNSAWLLLADGVNRASNFVLFLLLARCLGVGGYGRFWFAMGYAAMFGPLAAFGLNTLITREVAQGKDQLHGWLARAFGLQLVLASLVVVGMGLSLALWEKPQDDKAVALLFGLYVAVLTVNQFMQAIFRGYERMDLEAAARVAQTCALFTMVLVAALSGANLVALGFAYVAAAIFGFSVTRRLLSRVADIEIALEPARWLELGRSAWPFALAIIASQVCVGVDKVFLSAMRGDTEVGMYSAAATLIGSLNMLSAAIGGAALPTFSSMRGKLGLLRRGLAAVIGYTLLGSIVLSVVLAILAEPLISLLYGVAFLPSVSAFRVMLIGFIIVSANNVIAAALNSIGGEKRVAIVALLGAATALALNPVLIAALGFNGAGVAFVLSVLVSLLAGLFYTWDILATSAPSHGLIGVEVEPVHCDLCGEEARQLLFSATSFHLRFRIMRCVRCGLVYTDPRCRADLYQESYFTGEDNALPGRDFRHPRDLRNSEVRFNQLLALVEKLRPGRRGRLLDVGCAIGTLPYLARQRGWDAAAVEPSLYAASYARDVYGIDTFAGQLREAGFSPATFDVITMVHVLEHIERPCEFLEQEVLPILKDNGLLVIEVPNFGSLQAKLLKEKNFDLRPEQHLYHFTQETMIRTLEKGGFRVVKTMTLPAPFTIQSFLSSVGIEARFLHQSRDDGQVGMGAEHLVARACKMLAAAVLWLLSRPVTLAMTVTRLQPRLIVLAEPRERGRGRV